MPERGSAAASSLEQAKTALPCMVCPGIWPKCSRTACVMHWNTQRDGAGQGEGFSLARAGRRPLTSSEFTFGPSQGLNPGASWCVRVRGAGACLF